MFPTLLKVVDEVISGVILAQRISTWLQPATIANPLLTTMAALASLLTLALLSGVAISSVVVLLTAMLAIYFIITEVLGITVEVSVP